MRVQPSSPVPLCHCFSKPVSSLDVHWSRGDCSSGCFGLIVLDLLLSTDEFHNPVHFPLDSEGDQAAAARAAPANAGRVTCAPSAWTAVCH